MMDHLIAAIGKMDAKTDANQEKMDTTLKEMEAGQELLKEEMLAKLDDHHRRMMARMDSQLEKMEAIVEAFKERLKEMNTKDLEASQEKSEVVAEQQDIPKEEPTVKTVGAPEDRYGNQHLTIGRH
jgi:hypothetical protein